MKNASHKRGKRGLTGHRVGEWHPKVMHSDETVRRARKMRERGMSYGKISKEIGVNVRTVADWLRYDTRYSA